MLLLPRRYPGRKASGADPLNAIHVPLLRNADGCRAGVALHAIMTKAWDRLRALETPTMRKRPYRRNASFTAAGVDIGILRC